MELAEIDIAALGETIQRMQVAAALGAEQNPPPMDVGSVVFLQDGWERPRVEFYVVVRRTARTVVMRRLGMRGFPEWREPPEDSDVLPVAEWPTAPDECEPVRAWLVSEPWEADMVKAGSKYGWAWSGRPLRSCAPEAPEGPDAGGRCEPMELS